MHDARGRCREVDVIIELLQTGTVSQYGSDIIIDTEPDMHAQFHYLDLRTESFPEHFQRKIALDVVYDDVS